MSRDKSRNKAKAVKRLSGMAMPERGITSRRRGPRKADWAVWRAMPMVLLRDAVALSLDFEPSSVTMEHLEFAGRLKIAIAQFRARRLLKINMREHVIHPSLTQVWLPHFAAWARQKPKWALPPPLAEIAQAKLSFAVARAAGPSNRYALQAKSWQEAVRALADELHLQDQKAGTWSSNKNIAGRVAVEAIKHSIEGPRGPLSPENILRAALQGGKWKRPRPKARGRSRAKLTQRK